MSNGHDEVHYSLLSANDTDTIVDDPESRRSRSSSVSRSPLSSGPSTMNRFAGRLRGSQRVTFLAVLTLALLVIVWLLSSMDTSQQPVQLPEVLTNLKPSIAAAESVPSVMTLPPDASRNPSDLDIKYSQNDVDWYQQNCYGINNELTQSISDIFKKLELLKKSEIGNCSTIWKIFNEIISIEEISAPIVLPELFQIEVRGWLDNDTKLFDQVNNQLIYKIVNKGTYEETLINPIRSRRPSSKSNVDPLTYAKNVSDSTKSSCDFCRYGEHTAEDTFGRIDNKLSASCSNTFKLAKFHALFFPKQHYPLNLTLEQLNELFLQTSQQWFNKAHSIDKIQKFPSLLWDVLPHAGASQVHPHVHGILDPNQYVGGFESWHQLSRRYFKNFKRSFWTDFVKVHIALGLGYVKKNAVVITPLTARKDHEFMILSNSVNEDFVSLIQSVLSAYQNKLNVYCYSSGGVYPVIGDSTEGISGMPAIFRFGSRGTCSAIASDVSSLELYTTNNINTDFAKTFGALLETVNS